MPKSTLRDLKVRGKRVLVRVDYNVPLEDRNGQRVITDFTRIRETLPTLEWLVDQGARLILMSHLGRPEGKPDAALSLRPVAGALADLIGRPVAFVDSCHGDKVQNTAGLLQPGDILLLENLRFHPEEEANDPVFAGKLAALGDIYVNDAFGAAHRAHASTEGVPRLMIQRGSPCAPGFLMEKELKFLGEELEQPERPFLVILGGAKVSDKINVINRLLDKADSILVGGAMVYTFKLAEGAAVGKSLVEPDKADVARQALAKAKERKVAFLLPSDHITARAVKTGRLNAKGKPVIEFQDPRMVTGDNIPAEESGVDIGPQTIETYSEAIRGARTILWNGPMGIFEDPRFATGTFAIAGAVAARTTAGAKSIIGGGDSVKAVNQAGLGAQVTFMSTGGGASLEFLEGKELPGVAVLSSATSGPAPSATRKS